MKNTERRQDVALVMPVHNQLKYTKIGVEGVLRTAPYAKLIVIDNGSHWSTGKFLKSKKVKVIRNKENLFVAKSWNQGVKAAMRDQKIKYIGIINNDIEFTDGWLDELLKVLEEHDDIWCACPSFTAFSKPKGFPKNKRKKLAPDILPLTTKIWGWCFVVKREAFEALGLFDEKLKIWSQDTDFHRRLMEEEKPPVEVRASYIHHYQNKTLFALPNWHKRAEEDVARYEEKTRLEEHRKTLNLKALEGKKIVGGWVDSCTNRPIDPEGHMIIGESKFFRKVPDWAFNNPSYSIRWKDDRGNLYDNPN